MRGTASCSWSWVVLLGGWSLLVPKVPRTTASTFKTSVSNVRDVGPSFLSDGIESALPEWCQLEMNRTIVLGHPQSITRGDRFYRLGLTSLEAVQMTIDQINLERCGVSVQGKNYSISLQTIGDNSNANKHQAIGNYLVDRTDFFIGGYSSGLTESLAAIAQDNQQLLVAGGAAGASVFVNRDYVFGTFPPSNTYLTTSLDAFLSRGASSIALLVEEDFLSCTLFSGLQQSINQHGGVLLLPTVFFPSNPSVADLEQVVELMETIDPDIVAPCGLAEMCGRLVEAMRNRNWTPKAVLFVICFGTTELEVAAESDLFFMTGAVSWDRSLPAIPDAVTGWTPADFASDFEEFAFVNATYQNTAAAASVTVLVQAIEAADSLDTELVREQVATRTFDTMYGEISFDANGQSNAISVVGQYHVDGKLHIVYPPDSSDGAEMVYPLPTWATRDCMLLAPCTAIGGSCVPDGTCDCQNVTGTTPWGEAEKATCKNFGAEDMGYIEDAWIALGYSAFALQTVMSCLAIAWTLINRQEKIVRASQPFFLILIAIGCFVLSSAILPAGVEGEYRVERNETTGLFTDTKDPDIDRVDAACMAVPWLAGMGFAIVFSALFAKIYRVKKMLDNAGDQNRKLVGIKDVISIMVIMILVEAVLLLSWQLTDPLQWNRDVLQVDSDGSTVASVGSCESDLSTQFIVPLVVVNGVCLVYALWLCYVTRFVPSEFAEVKWITISIVSIFQIFLLAVPVLVIAEDDRTAFYFVEVGVISLVSAGVTVLIFAPKAWRLYNGNKDEEHRRISTRVSSRPHPSESKSSNGSKGSKGSKATTKTRKTTNAFQEEPEQVPVKDDVLRNANSHGWGALTIGGLGDSETEEASPPREASTGTAPPPRKDDVLLSNSGHGGWGGLTIGVLHSEMEDPIAEEEESSGTCSG